MGNSDEITLTRALYGLTKNTAKIAFLFLLISAILISITYNDADPSFSTHTLVNNQEKVLYTFSVSDSDSKLHLAYFTTDDSNSIDYIDFRIQKIGLMDITEDVIISLSTQFYRELSLDSGNYQVVATLFLKAGVPIDTRIDVISGYGNVNLVLAGLSILTLVIGAISTGLFFAVLPFTILVLIVNSFNKPRPQSRRRPVETYRSETDTRPQSVEGDTSNQVAQSSVIGQESDTIHPEEYNRPYRFDPNSFVSKFTARDWTWLIIALISFVGFIFSPDSPFLVFTIIITAVIIYSVSEREKTKYRILILLKNYETTSVGFLSRQIGKKEKYITKILQIMILDDAMPIVLNLSNYRVHAIGPLDPFIEDKPKVYHPLTPTTTNTFEERPQEVEPLEVVEPTPQTPVAPTYNAEVTMHCTACGEGLIGNPKYCYVCGQKTI